ncbi:helix-turn-helix domain-containing protein [Cupriavidus sp. P-10]|uniref:LuxR C-terminal-related transcriptional regulator n=1 Tax=Cupriavidus sp. P-10 TaxID=2027911 RepID=UPI001F3F9F5B|nr:LuxR C-terminal-related transcriptional regulator [Cupriavidus sp. P-10]BDB27513.1 helix-turn-helix domain-containing protein [Cupriavidus sp. P-10]
MTRAPDAPARLAQRARIVLLAASGEQNKAIAPQLGISRAQVARWRERYAMSGVSGILRDLPRGAPPVRVDVERLAMLTGCEMTGVSRGWSTRSLAAELGVSAMSVSRHWRAAGARPGASSQAGGMPMQESGGAAEASFAPEAPSPEIIALYAAPPAYALVLSVADTADQADQADQADNDAAGPLPPHGSNHMRTLPAHRRSLAVSLVTALAMLEGGLPGAPASDTGHEALASFLQKAQAAAAPGRRLLALAVSHAGACDAPLQHWLRAHPRITVQLAHGPASWLRMVHRFVRDTQAERAGAFPAGIPELLAAVEAAMRAGTDAPFQWVRTTTGARHVPPAAEPARIQPATVPSPAGWQAPTAEARERTPIAGDRVLPPRGTRQLMPRDTLLKRLMEARRQRCVVIQGQAGSGKTSTLMAWRKAILPLGYDVCWLTLTAEDDEPVRFFDYLLASIAEVDPAAASEAARVVGADSSDTAVELWVITLVRALARRQRELVLMIDDLHHITDMRILQALQWLLDYAPAPLHLAFSSRSALELSMERLRLQGALAEFDMRDLRFTPDESERFLREQLGSIGSNDAATLHALTDGWVAGLQLFAIELRTRQGGRSPLARVGGTGAFSGYFEREVLVHLAPANLDMLASVAICQRFCAPLCAEIVGRPTAIAPIQSRLGQMVLDHLFVTAECGADHVTWYRVHPLLREALLERLPARGEAGQRALHQTAWRWFERHGHIEEAVFHAVKAGQVDAAASMVEGCAQALLTRGQLRQLAALMRLLPVELVQRRFGLHVVNAYMQLYSRDFDQLQRSLDQIESRSEQLDASERYALCLLRAGFALQLDNTDAAAAMLPRLLDAPADLDDFAWHARGNVLSWLLTARGEYDLARRVLEEAELRTGAHRSGQLGRCIHAISLAREGRIKQAGKIVREVMEEAERRGAAYQGLACMAAGLLADTLHESNEAEAACQLLEPRIDMLERVSLPEIVLRACRVLSNSHWLAGRQAQALAYLDRLENYAVRYGLDRLLAEALVLRLRRHLQQDEMERASVVLECVQGVAERYAGAGPERSGQIALAAARGGVEMALHTKDYANAIERIQLLLAGSEQAPGAAGLRLQLAIARLGLGEQQAARQDFLRAIRQGHRLELTRTLLDVLESAPDLLIRLGRDAAPDPVLAFYVERLHKMSSVATARQGQARGSEDAGPMAALSEREREILHLLAQAMSNKKIARVLNLSTETVKWHLKNVYAKLGVGGRGGAAARLRDLSGDSIQPTLRAA